MIERNACSLIEPTRLKYYGPLLESAMCMKVVVKRCQGNMLMSLKKEGIFIHVLIKLRKMRELLITEKWNP
jgi:hypothetical protein